MRAPRDHNLTYSLVESLGQAIVMGEYAKEPFPTEADLTKHFGTSRSVTREAVKMLTAKGLLSARPRQGTSVEPESSWSLFDPDVLRWLLERKFSLKLLADFTEMRLAIEPVAAHLAATRADAAALAGIRRGIERMKAASRGEDDALAADIAFHIAILDATDNPFFAQLHDLVNTALRISIRFTNRIKGRTASVRDHEAVMNAIIAREPKRAAEAMRGILNEVLELIAAASAKPASTKPDSAKLVSAKPDSPKPASPRPVSAKPDSPKPASPKPVSAKPTSAKPGRKSS